jgi:GR25 family glycosyltransferase involved in LPS biosynthesis
VHFQIFNHLFCSFFTPKPLHVVVKIYFSPFKPLRCIRITHSTWGELMALMSYYFARLWKHISSIFGTIGRREHIQRFLTILRNFGMREPINGILNTSLLEIKGRFYRLLHIINEFSHLRLHSFPLINILSQISLACFVK